MKQIIKRKLLASGLTILLINLSFIGDFSSCMVSGLHDFSNSKCQLQSREEMQKEFNGVIKVDDSSKSVGYIQELDLSEIFKNCDGCAILSKGDKHYVYNSKIANIEKSPCSTFKIVLTLAGLKYGALKDADTIIRWDGKKRYFENWNKDLRLEEAFKTSAVWYFEKVANEIGKEKLTEFISSISYGNGDTSGGMPFWVDSSLKISPIQQIDFLRNLFERKLPVDECNVRILKKIMNNAIINGGELYGKTGTSGEGNIGWFVGFYEKENEKLYFAVILYDGENISGKQAEKITKNIINDQF